MAFSTRTKYLSQVPFRIEDSTRLEEERGGERVVVVVVGWRSEGRHPYSPFALALQPCSRGFDPLNSLVEKVAPGVVLVSPSIKKCLTATFSPLSLFFPFLLLLFFFFNPPRRVNIESSSQFAKHFNKFRENLCSNFLFLFFFLN